MSHYTGPGVYALIPMHAGGQRVSVWGGGSTSGTAVKTYQVVTADNLLWEIVAAGGNEGHPEVGDRQYHIIGVQSGLMLCAAEDGSGSNCTVSTRNVKHGSSRWKIHPGPNGTYYFQSVISPDNYLAVSGAGSADGTDVMTYRKQEATHFQFKIIRP